MPVVRLSTAARNAAAAAVMNLLDAGPAAATIQIRSGTMPADPQTAATGTLLATVTLVDPAAGAPATGVATITNPAPVTVAATGTAGWARFLDSAGVTVLDCDVTATGGGGAIQLANTALSSGTSLDLAALTYTQPQG